MTDTPDCVQVVMQRQHFDSYCDWLARNGWAIFPIPNGVDEEGFPVFDNKEELPTFAPTPTWRA